ncbi:MAG: TonB family protein [Acidobacteria bacterium]|nr:TonB family protein [Acidobacteriota bacterium]
MTARMAVLLFGAATLPAAQLVELTAITEYPLLAVSARISGTVRVACRLAADGVVQSVRVLEGPPLLALRAAEAAKLWRFNAPQKGSEDPAI